MLNRELRPFLARWHPELRRWEQAHPDADEATWPQARECRRELASLQVRIHQYAVGYAKLAGIDDAADLIAGRIT